MAESRKDFVARLMPAAIAASEKTGIDPRLIVAQAAHESGWGEHAPGNNLFGIKAHGASNAGPALETTEVVGGKPVSTTASFRTYKSPEDSVAGWADFISSNPRYRGVTSAKGLDAQIEAMGKSGYATDPAYASKLRSIAANLPEGGSSSGGTMTASRPPGAGAKQRSTLAALGMADDEPAERAATATGKATSGSGDFDLVKALAKMQASPVTHAGQLATRSMIAETLGLPATALIPQAQQVPSDQVSQPTLMAQAQADPAQQDAPQNMQADMPAPLEQAAATQIDKPTTGFV